MSDAEFDALEQHLLNLGSKAPEQVGAKRKDFDFEHPTKMLSLGKIQTEAREDAYGSKLDPIVRGNDRFLRGPGPAYMDSQFSRCMKLKGYRRVKKEELGDTKRRRLYSVTEQWSYPISSD